MKYANTKVVVLPTGEEVLVDEEDYERVSKVAWHITPQGRVVKNKCLRQDQNGTRTALHRFILGVTDPSIQIDHINRNPLDNRKSNLRVCNQSQNNCNRGKLVTAKTTSKYKGVSYKANRKKNPWYCKVKYQGKHLHLGCFSTEREAGLCYNKFALEHYGEFALLNDIQEVADNEVQKH